MVEQWLQKASYSYNSSMAHMVSKSEFVFLMSTILGFACSETKIVFEFSDAVLSLQRPNCPYHHKFQNYHLKTIFFV